MKAVVKTNYTSQKKGGVPSAEKSKKKKDISRKQTSRKIQEKT